MAKSDKREIVHLACSECKRRNYSTNKNRKINKLELKKYCPWCKSHQLHKQTK